MELQDVKVGMKLRATQDIGYCMGQVEEDKICEDEIVTVDGIKEDAITVEEHADRYGPWPIDYFEPVPVEELKCFDCHGYKNGCIECEV